MASARVGYESRLSLLPADSTLGENPDKIDYAAWPAISGDHSCSSEKMLYNVLETEWILGVADVAARLKRRLNEVGWERHKRINVLRDSDIELQAADLAYATRAGSNNVHFLLARPNVDTNGSTSKNVFSLPCPTRPMIININNYVSFVSSVPSSCSLCNK